MVLASSTPDISVEFARNSFRFILTFSILRLLNILDLQFAWPMPNRAESLTLTKHPPARSVHWTLQHWTHTAGGDRNHRTAKPQQEKSHAPFVYRCLDTSHVDGRNSISHDEAKKDKRPECQRLMSNDVQWTWSWLMSSRHKNDMRCGEPASTSQPAHVYVCCADDDDEEMRIDRLVE